MNHQPEVPAFLFYEELPSTNTTLKLLSETESLAEFSVVITNHQNAGRGQMGNQWESESGMNLTFSILLTPTFLPVASQFMLSKAISLAIVDLLEELEIPEVTIKWPNDIYSKDKKLAGILIENNIMGANLSQSIVGIGLNVNQLVFKSDAPNPVSMALLTGQEYPIEMIFNKLIDAIMDKYYRLSDGADTVINRHYLDKFYRSSGTHPFKDSNGNFEASIHGVDEFGRLMLLSTDNNIRVYEFKEVEFVI
jgi:BirA family biotin operon repressor/biotin-[acetyl-CoA-carboxylase] ligase